MTDIEKLKELAVPVSEGVPKEGGEYYVIVNPNRIIDNDERIEVSLFVDNGQEQFFVHTHVTHWIDFSLFTTKAKAIELAEKTVEYGYCILSYDSETKRRLDKYISENQSKL